MTALSSRTLACFVGLVIAISVVSGVSGPIKYALLLGLTVICVWVRFDLFKAHAPFYLYTRAVLLFSPFVFLAGFGLAVVAFRHPEALTQGVKQVIMYIEPMLVSSALLFCAGKEKGIVIDALFLAAGGVLLVTGTVLFNATDYMESAAAFSFGLFALYYLHEKRGCFFLLSLLLMFLAHKRIAMGALLLAITVFFTIKSLRLSHRGIALSYVAFIGAVFFYNYGISNGFTQSIFSTLGIETMGRFSIYSHFDKEIANAFASPGFGEGVGYVLHILGGLAIPGSGNLHNDWLSIILEVGLLGFAAFVVLNVAFLFVASKDQNRKTRAMLLALVLYWQLIWLTDNTAIYVQCLIPYYCVMLSILDEKTENSSLCSTNKVSELTGREVN